MHVPSKKFIIIIINIIITISSIIVVVYCEGGSQWAGVSEVVRQPSPGPVSLEIFGLEEKEDEPLQLPLQAAITVLPTPDLGMHLTSFMQCSVLELCKQFVLGNPLLLLTT